MYHGAYEIAFDKPAKESATGRNESLNRMDRCSYSPLNGTRCRGVVCRFDYEMNVAWAMREHAFSRLQVLLIICWGQYSLSGGVSLAFRWLGLPGVPLGTLSVRHLKKDGRHLDDRSLHISDPLVRHHFAALESCQLWRGHGGHWHVERCNMRTGPTVVISDFLSSLIVAWHFCTGAPGASMGCRQHDALQILIASSVEHVPIWHPALVASAGVVSQRASAEEQSSLRQRPAVYIY